jgi:transposase
MTDAEWEFLRHLLPGTAQGGPGRPIPDLRARLDAIFRAVTLKHPQGGRAFWSQLPESHGRHGTIARCFRRWAHAGLWATLLALVADRDGRPPESLLLGLRYRICCTFRRAHRLLGLHSALPAPSSCLPDPDLSAIYRNVIARALNRLLDGLCQDPDGTGRPAWRPPRAAWRLFRSMLAVAGGRRRLSRALEPA